MATFDFYLDINSITRWLNDLSFQCIPDWEALVNEPLSSTFDVFSTNLIVAVSTTLNALQAWTAFLFHLCRLCAHILFLSIPYIKPVVVSSFKYWNSLDLTVQLCVLASLSAVALLYWIRKNRFIGRGHHYVRQQMDRTKSWFTGKWQSAHKWCTDKWQSLIHWISVRSQMTAQIFPHLVWWSLLWVLLWFAPESLYEAHSVWSFIGCFVFPMIKTYSNIRKYAMFTPSGSTLNEKEKSLVLLIVCTLSVPFHQTQPIRMLTVSLIQSNYVNASTRCGYGCNSGHRVHSFCGRTTSPPIPSPLSPASWPIN